MKKLFAIMFAAVVAVSTSSRSDAGLFVTVDLDGAAGVQPTNSTPLNIGDTITARLLLQTTDASTLAAYNFSVQWGSAFEFVSRTETPFSAALSEFDTTNGVNGNTALRFDGGTVGAGQLTPLGPNQVGSLTLRYIGGNATGITPGLFEPAFDQWFDAAGNEVTNAVQFAGGNATVAAVPEPTSMAALAAAGIGGWVVRRRAARKKAAAAAE